MLYTNKANIERYLLIQIDNSFNAQIDSWIQAMSRHIDSRTSRRFGEYDVETRVYDGNNTSHLLVDDFYELDTVEVDGVAFDVVAQPYNVTPQWKLVSKDNRFTRGVANVEVTGRFGYGSIPEDIEHACTVLVAGIINAQTQQEGEIASEKIGDYQVSYRSEEHKTDTEMALAIVKRYAKPVL